MANQESPKNWDREGTVTEDPCVSSALARGSMWNEWSVGSKAARRLRQEKCWGSIITFRDKKVFGDLSKTVRAGGWSILQGCRVKGWGSTEWRVLPWLLQKVSLQRVGCHGDRSQTMHESRKVFLLLWMFCFLRVQRFECLFKPRERSQVKRDCWRYNSEYYIWAIMVLKENRWDQGQHWRYWYWIKDRVSLSLTIETIRQGRDLWRWISMQPGGTGGWDGWHMMTGKEIRLHVQRRLWGWINNSGALKVWKKHWDNKNGSQLRPNSKTGKQSWWWPNRGWRSLIMWGGNLLHYWFSSTESNNLGIEKRRWNKVWHFFLEDLTVSRRALEGAWSKRGNEVDHVSKVIVLDVTLSSGMDQERGNPGGLDSQWGKKSYTLTEVLDETENSTVGGKEH